MWKTGGFQATFVGDFVSQTSLYPGEGGGDFLRFARILWVRSGDPRQSVYRSGPQDGGSSGARVVGIA